MFGLYIYYTFDFLVAAEITDGLIDRLENETSPIIFSCVAIGEPVPSITWHFNGVMIIVSNTSNYNISNKLSGTTMITSALAIVNAQSPDVGTYSCLAQNSIGSDRSLGVLTVNGMRLFP